MVINIVYLHHQTIRYANIANSLITGNSINILKCIAMTDLDARQEIAEINSMSLRAVQVLYNVDTKDEAIQGVLESIESEPEYDYTENELEEEREYLCMSQGLSRYC